MYVHAALVVAVCERVELSTSSCGAVGCLSACPQVFSLDYQVEAPVSAVIHSEASDAYSRLFHLLWRVKRIEWSLAASWK